MRKFTKVFAACFNLFFILRVLATPTNPAELEDWIAGTHIYETLGHKIDLDVPLIDKYGHPVTPRDYLKKSDVVIFTFNFFRCTGLCPMQYRNIVDTLNHIPVAVGKPSNFHIVSVSFDPLDTPQQAHAMTQAWRSMLKNKKITWDFVVGSKKNTKKLAHQFQFYYAKDGTGYNHSAGLFFVDKGGVFQKFLMGSVYSSDNFQHALFDSSGRTARSLGISFWERLKFLTQKYNLQRGKYLSYDEK